MAFEDVEKLDISHTACWNMKWYSHATLENTLAISNKTRYALIIQPSNQSLEHLSQGNENLHSHKKTIQMLIVFFVLATSGKQLKHPSIGDRLNKLAHLYNGISFIKKENNY